MAAAPVEGRGLLTGAMKNVVALDKWTISPSANGNNQFSAGQSCTS